MSTSPRILAAKGKAILHVLDQPRRKSDPPIKPALVEFFGEPKAGKDKQLVGADRRFRRMKFQTLVYQEGAESEKQRRAPRDFSYEMQMRYFAQAFDNLLHAAVSRDFHIAFFNRGVLDILTWLEFQRKLGKITQEQLETARTFILHGPWIQTLDVIVCLVVDAEAALEREYGKDFRSREVVFGSMMNPKSLALMKESVSEVCSYLKKDMPDLPLYVLDTTHKTEEETEAEIAEILLTTLERRLKISEDDTLPWSIDLMREKAWVSGPEVKIRGSVTHEKLRKLGWSLEAAVTEVDDYLTPKDEKFLEGDACFHLRSSGGKHYLVYKKNLPLAWHRPKIPIPISGGSVKELRATFEEVLQIRKEREIFTRNGFVLHLDRVEGLGNFIEIKGLMATTDEELMAAAMELGFSEGDIVNDTYLRLMLATKTAS